MRRRGDVGGKIVSYETCRGRLIMSYSHAELRNWCYIFKL